MSMVQKASSFGVESLGFGGLRRIGNLVLELGAECVVVAVGHNALLVEKGKHPCLVLRASGFAVHCVRLGV